MNRRDFVRVTGTGLTAGALAEAAVSAQVAARPAAARAATRAKMKAGTQHGDSDSILRVLAGFGVNHICSRLPSAQMGPEWSEEALIKRREHVESFGLTLDMVPLPMSSSEISRSESPAIIRKLRSPPPLPPVVNTAVCQLLIRDGSAAMTRTPFPITIRFKNR